LAWAITIHKSQGLTFEKAIIDAEASFAHGQTYVALSRCKSLEGIILKTPIIDTSIINDSKVESFTKDVEKNQPDSTILTISQKQYQLNLIIDLLNYYEFTYPLKRIIDIYYQNKTSIIGNIIEILPAIKDKVTDLLKISTSFKNQLEKLSDATNNLENDKSSQERIQKAITYYKEFTTKEIKIPFETIHFTTDNKQVEKDLNKPLDQLDDLLSIKLFCLNGLKTRFSVTKYLELRAKATLQKSSLSVKSIKKKREDITFTNHPVLFEELRELRHTLAQTENLNHYQIFTQKSLYEMCEYFPTTIEQLNKINGMGKIRVDKYGGKILDIIKKYTKQNNIESKDIRYIENIIIKEKQSKSNTKQASYELFKEGKTVDEIVSTRGLVKSTIQRHLISFVSTGELKVTDLIPEEKYQELKKLMSKIPFETLSELKEKIDDKFSYNDIRLVRIDNELNKEIKENETVL